MSHGEGANPLDFLDNKNFTIADPAVLRFVSSVFVNGESV
jgi:hypothetical protein